MLRADPRVAWVGWVDRPREVFSAFDVFALPTYREGLPNVLIEASALALPIVATRATGCVDVVLDGVTGALVPVGEAGPLADALLRYVRDPELGRRHGAAGRDRAVLLFDRARITEALRVFYDGLLAARRDAKPQPGRGSTAGAR
jgi:glycosyltransferase involved in cell wall biosynthesis